MISNRVVGVEKTTDDRRGNRQVFSVIKAEIFGVIHANNLAA
jgi:hypothetical protein